MEATTRRKMRRPRCWIVSAAALVSCICVGLVTPPLAALSKDDKAFADFLITEVHYYDVALRWFDSLEKQGGLSAKDHADIAWAIADLLKAQGKGAESLKKVAENRKRFPGDPRASLGDMMESIKSAMSKAIARFSSAAPLSDQAKAAALRAEGAKVFEDEVSKPLDALIADLQKRLDEAKKAARSKEGDDKARKKAGPKREESPEMTNLLTALEYAELVRIQFDLTYSRQLPQDSPERKALLEKGANLAESFVNDRFDFPVMIYNAQLHRGLYAYELGQFADAEEQLSILYEAQPSSRPFSKEAIDEFKGLRLQSVLFGARARNTARNCSKAVQLIQEHYLKPRKDEFDLTKAEDDPVVRTTAVLVRLEYGIALAGSGQAQKGLDEIQKVIDKPGMDPALLTDARKALGRIAVMGGVRLRARDYYQAAIGLKSDGRWEEAIDTFQDALSRLSSRNANEMSELAPLCLNEIGEINHVLGNLVESAVAYQEVCRNFPSTPPELLAKVARNFLASANRAVKATPGGASHSGLLQLKEEATKEAEKHAGGFTTLELLMSDAKGFEKDGKYREASKKYLEVPHDQKGVKVPFYWRAQANAWTCIYRMWELADDEGKKKLEDDIVKVIAELEKIVPTAIKENDKGGAAVGALTLGQAQYYRGEHQKAADTLKLFTSDLADEEMYRCYGLGTLVMSESKMGAVEDAEKHFKENLFKLKECRANAIIAAAASGLAEGFEARENPKKAAIYALVAAKHASSKADLENPQYLANLIRRLIDGDDEKNPNIAKHAREYLEKLKGMKATDDCLARQVLSLEAKVFQHSKEWNKVIAKLENYVNDYKPQVEDKCYEDAYVLKDLGQAYLSRELRAPLKDLKKADEWNNAACAVMQRRAQRDKSLEKTFWQWALELMKIKMRIGDAGEVNAYLNITNFVASNEAQEGDWGGTKSQFQDLAKQAAARYAKATAK